MAARKDVMESSEREEDAILRMLIYVKFEMIRNSFKEEVILIEKVIDSIERSIQERRDDL